MIREPAEAEAGNKDEKKSHLRDSFPVIYVQ